MEGDYNSRLNKMQKEEYLIKNACYSVTKYYLCKRNNKRSLLGRKQRSQVARSFPNRYQFSCTNKVTSLFSISCILRIILTCDYVDMLRRLGKDVHSPKYLCAKDLKAEHDRIEDKIRRQREKEEIERKWQKAIEDEKCFRELKSKFFGIHFTDGTIQVPVLESVQEHLEEGVAMHHCVLCKPLHNTHYANQINM